MRDPTSPPPERSSSTPTSTHSHIGEQTVFGPPAGSTRASGCSCSTSSGPGAVTHGPGSAIKPVIDLNAHLTAPGYDIPDRIREHVVLRDRTCVFPWCTRPARGCDIDHVIAYDHDAAAEGRPQPGPTTSDNLAALCRFHHRPQDPHRLALPRHRTRCVRLDQPPRPPVPTRLQRHHPSQRGRSGAAGHSATPPTMTPPRTPPVRTKAGAQACQNACLAHSTRPGPGVGLAQAS